MPAFIPGNKENAKRPKDIGKWCDMDYFDGLRDPRGYTDPNYDNRKGYGLMFWNEGYVGTVNGLLSKFPSCYTFLELGCAKGFLVQAMRMRGVEAYGVDVSEYATSNCHPDMKPYIFCQSATNLSRFKDDYFDLIYSWDFMEHLSPDEIILCLKECKRVGKKWIYHGVTIFDQNYGSIAEQFPDEPQDPTHVSCYKKEWWEEIFNMVFNKKDMRIRWLGEPFVTGSKRRAEIEVVINLGEKN